MKIHEITSPLSELAVRPTVRPSAPAPEHTVANTAAGAVSNTAKSTATSYIQGKVISIAETAIRNLIAKRVPELMQSSALKSIPALGTIWSLYNVGASLVQGDKTGALLNAAGMIPGGAIPAMCAACANQMYSEVYMDVKTKQPADLATDLASDPAGTGSRIQKLVGMIMTEVQSVIKKGMDILSKNAEFYANAPAGSLGESLNDITTLAGVKKPAEASF